MSQRSKQKRERRDWRQAQEIANSAIAKALDTFAPITENDTQKTSKGGSGSSVATEKQ